MKRGNRWYWKIKLPGEKKYQQMSLKPVGADRATTDLATAIECARLLYDQAVLVDEYDPQDNSLAGVCRAFVSSDSTTEGEKRAYIVSIKYLAEVFDCSIPAYEFSPRQLRQYQEYLADKRLSVTTVNRNAANVRRIIKWAVGEGYVPAATYLALTAISGIRSGKAKPAKKVRPVSDEVINATLPYLSDVVADMVRLQRITGMRSTELCIIKPEQIERYGNIWNYYPSKYKGQHLNRVTEKVIPLGEHAQEILRPYMLRSADQYTFTPAESMAQHRRRRNEKRVTDRRFGNRPGTNAMGTQEFKPCFTAASYGKAIQNAIKAAERDNVTIPYWTPHQLRHAAGTAICDAMGIEAASGMLGHSSLSITQRYAPIGYTQAVKVAKQMG